MSVSRKIASLCLVAMLLVLAACGNNAGNTNTSNNASNNSSNGQAATEAPTADNENNVSYPRTLTDPLGHSVEISAEPQRVLASYLEDYLVALGIKPVAQWSVSDRPMQYLQYELEGTPLVPYDLPYEVVTSYEPDLIIIGDESLIANDKYDTYQAIAPTYALGTEVNADWRKALLEVGKVVGKESEAEAVLADYEQKAQDAKAKLAAAADPAPSATAIWLVGGTFWMVSEGQSSGAVLYDELGFAVPELVKTISQTEGGIWKSVSMEALAELDADHIFLVNSDAEAGSEALKDPVWQSIKAVKDGNVHEFGPESSWLYTGPIANSQIIDDVLESLKL